MSESSSGRTAEDQQDPARRRLVRPAVGAAVVTALVTTVAVATESPRLHVDPDTFAIQLWLLPVAWVLLGAVAVGTVVLMFLAAKARRESGADADVGKRAGWILALVVLGLVAALGLIDDLPGSGAGGRGAPPADRGAPLDPGDRAVRTRPPAPFVAAGAVLAIAAVAVVALRSRHEQPRAAPPVRTPAQDAGVAIARGRARLTTAADPRSAILAAYRAMEEVFAQAGHGRDETQTSHEFLTHVLLETHADPVSVRRLTALFEIARYSDHAVSEDMRDDALELLERIDDSVRVSTDARAAG